MSDAARRSRTRSPEDLEGLAGRMREGLRSGSLSEELVELLAHLGHHPACLALDRPPPFGEHVKVERWAGGLRLPFWLALIRASAREQRATIMDWGSLDTPQLAELLEPVLEPASLRLQEEFVGHLARVAEWSADPAQPWEEPFVSSSPEVIHDVYGHGVRALLAIPSALLDWERESGCSDLAHPAASWGIGELKGLVWVGPLALPELRLAVADEICESLLGTLFLPTPTPPSEAPYLVWQLEQGILDPGALRAAAEAGHPPAVEVSQVEPLAERGWLETQTSRAVLESWLRGVLAYLPIELELANQFDEAPEAGRAAWRQRVYDALTSFSADAETDEELRQALAAAPEADPFLASFVATAAALRATLGSDLEALHQSALALWSLLPGDVAEQADDAAKAVVISEALETA